MDICTLIIVTTLNAVPCLTVRQCDATMDGGRQNCTNFCRPLPNTYDCERPDGSKYIWTPELGEETVVRNTAR